MTATVASIWRHPIKSHGHEALEETALTAGRTLPWDRCWAVRHTGSSADGSGWAPCANFSRGAKAPALQAIMARLDDATGTVTLRHPDRPELRFRPDSEAQRFLDWVEALMPAGRAASAGIIRVPDRGMTDTDYPSVSLINLASHRAVGQRAAAELSPLRWRGNFLLDGLGPWQEFEWIGKRLRLGGAELVVRERIVRCLATAANPMTGQRDVDTLGLLNSGWQHTDFGVYAEVTASGKVRAGDRVELLP